MEKTMNEKPQTLRETEISRQFQQVESEVSDLQSLVRELRDNLICVLSEEVEQVKDQTEKECEVSSVKTEMGRRLEKIYGDTNITRNIVERMLKRLEL